MAVLPGPAAAVSSILQTYTQREFNQNLTRGNIIFVELNRTNLRSLCRPGPGVPGPALRPGGGRGEGGGADVQASPGQPAPLHRLAEVGVTLSPVLHCTDNTRDGKVVGPAGTPGQVLLSWLYSALLCCAGIQPADPQCEQGGRGPVQLQGGEQGGGEGDSARHARGTRSVTAYSDF